MHTRCPFGFTRSLLALSVGASLALSSSPSSAAGDAPAPGTLLVVAGTGALGFSGDGGPATQARLNMPMGVAFDAAGYLFVADLENRRVRKVTPEGMISTVAGGGSRLPSSVNPIPASEARLYPSHLAFDGAGNLFMASYFENRVWRMSPEGWVTTLVQVPGPIGVAVDAAGNLFIAEHDRRLVRKLTPQGEMTTVAGGGNKPPQTADGGPATQARLTAPFALAVDSAGNLFIADREAYRVRKVTPEGIISTVAGNGRPQVSGVGGPATAAGLRGPHGLAIDAAGNLYIADTFWRDRNEGRNNLPARERILKVVGVAAPGLIAGQPFPKP